VIALKKYARRMLVKERRLFCGEVRKGNGRSGLTGKDHRPANRWETQQPQNGKKVAYRHVTRSILEQKGRGAHTTRRRRYRVAVSQTREKGMG